MALSFGSNVSGRKALPKGKKRMPFGVGHGAIGPLPVEVDQFGEYVGSSSSFFW